MIMVLGFPPTYVSSFNDTKCTVFSHVILLQTHAISHIYVIFSHTMIQTFLEDLLLHLNRNYSMPVWGANGLELY